MAKERTADLLKYFFPSFFLIFLCPHSRVSVRPVEKPKRHNPTGQVGGVHMDPVFSWCTAASSSYNLASKIP